VQKQFGHDWIYSKLSEAASAGTPIKDRIVFSPFFVGDYWMGFPRFFTQHHRCQVICTDFHGKFQLSYHSFISVAEQWIQKKKPKVGKSVCIETILMKFQIATRLLSRSQDAFVSSSFCQCYRRSFWFSWENILKLCKSVKKASSRNRNKNKLLFNYYLLNS